MYDNPIRNPSPTPPPPDNNWGDPIEESLSFCLTSEGFTKYHTFITLITHTLNHNSDKWPNDINKVQLELHISEHQTYILRCCNIPINYHNIEIIHLIITIFIVMISVVIIVHKMHINQITFITILYDHGSIHNNLLSNMSKTQDTT